VIAPRVNPSGEFHFFPLMFNNFCNR
jgi:hypothetical protein